MYEKRSVGFDNWWEKLGSETNTGLERERVEFCVEREGEIARFEEGEKGLTS